MLLLAAVCFWGPYEPASNHNSVQQMPYTVGRGDDDDIGRPATRASVVLPVQMQGFLKDCNFRQIVNHRSAGNPANIAPAVCPVPSGAKAQHGKSCYNENDLICYDPARFFPSGVHPRSDVCSGGLRPDPRCVAG